MLNVIWLMRVLVFLLVFVPQLLFSQQDTIDIHQLDQNLFSKPMIQNILFEGTSRPINFFYSNVFEYRRKPFTGIAVELRNDKRFTIELSNGRILRLEEYSTNSNRLQYCYRRLEDDTLLALDTTNMYNVSVRSGKLYRRGAELRMVYNWNEGSVYNGRYEKCSGGDKCTDDGWTYQELADGLTISNSPGSNGWTTYLYKDGNLQSPVKKFSEAGVLLESYDVDERGDRDGLTVENWPNGKLMAFGRYKYHAKYGMWNYYDSTGHLYKREWYSRVYFDYNQMDSSKTFYTNGAIQKFWSEVYHIEKCGENEEFIGTWTEIEYYRNGKPQYRYTSSDEFYCFENHRNDTTHVWWYPDGSIKSIIAGGMKKEFYRNGQLCSIGLPAEGVPRNGVVRQWDSVGTIVFDRTYLRGRLVEARDESYGKVDTTREKLALQMAGITAMSFYPFPNIFAGPGGEVNYFLNAQLPDWKDSICIPDNIIDSVSYSIAGAYLLMKDSSAELLDSIFSSAIDFHPSPGVWYYTLEVVNMDSGEWNQTCRKGFIRSGHGQSDFFLEQEGYEIISFGNGTSAWNNSSYVGWVVIKTKRPINVIAFYRNAAGAHQNMILYYGSDPKQSREVRFYFVRNCDGDLQYNCKDQAYATFFISRRSATQNHYGGSFVFIVNSDQTVDYAGHIPWGNFYLPRFNYRHW